MIAKSCALFFVCYVLFQPASFTVGGIYILRTKPKAIGSGR